MDTAAPSARLSEVILLDGRAVEIRDLEPADEALYPASLERVSNDDLRLRFFSPAPLSAREIHRLVHYDRAEAVARAAIGRADGLLYGVARLHRTTEQEGEFAVIVRSDLAGQGLGRLLLEQVLDRAPSLGIRHVMGRILPENTAMLALASELGFAMAPEPGDPGIVRASRDIGAAPNWRHAA